MNATELIVQTREAAERAIPRICEDGPLFPLAWHARIFALTVALVESSQLEWKDFQERLVYFLKDHEDEDRHGDEITAHYFERWLEASEAMLTENGFIQKDDIVRQIEAIRGSAAEIRASQSVVDRPLAIG